MIMNIMITYKYLWQKTCLKNLKKLIQKANLKKENNIIIMNLAHNKKMKILYKNKIQRTKINYMKKLDIPKT